MMDLVNQFVEMMGDMEFALYVGISFFSVFLFFGLVGKLAGTKGALAAVPKAKEPPLVPAPEKAGDVKAPPAAETFLATVENKKLGATTAEPKPAGAGMKNASGAPGESASLDLKKDAGSAGPKPAPVVNSLEGAMMWDGDSGKKKKTKTPPAPPAPPARVLPPGYADPKTSAVKEKDSEKTVLLSSPAKGGGTATDPRVVPDEAVSKPAVPATFSANPASPVSLKTESTLVAKSSTPADTADASEGKPPVDFHMYETLVRRIAGLEAEVKKDPLYLDPLMRRVSLSEKKLDELTEKVKAPGLKTADPVSAGVEAELTMLREKVDRLQKLLEQLAEGPAGGTA